MVGKDDRLKLRMFSDSLIGMAFSWYVSLQLNNVLSRAHMEEMFHQQLYKAKTEVTMSDLSKIHQLQGEPVETYLTCSEITSFKCKLPLLKTEFVRLAQNGLEFKLLKSSKESNSGIYLSYPRGPPYTKPY